MNIYREFEIKTFQLGHDQWHACFRPIDRSRPIMINGVALGVINLGFAWPTPQVAVRAHRARLNDRARLNEWLVGRVASM
jgi:hypothetical protein